MHAADVSAGHAFLRDPQLMSLAELTRIVRAFRALLVEKCAHWRRTAASLRSTELTRAQTGAWREDVALTTRLALENSRQHSAPQGWIASSLGGFTGRLHGRKLNASVQSLARTPGIDAAAAAGLPIKITALSNAAKRRDLPAPASISACEVIRSVHEFMTWATRTIGCVSGSFRAAKSRTHQCLWPLEPVARPIAARLRHVIVP